MVKMVFSRDVTAAMLVFLKNGTNPPVIELYYRAKVFFFPEKNKVTDHVSENTPLFRFS